MLGERRLRYAMRICSRLFTRKCSLTTVTVAAHCSNGARAHARSLVRELLAVFNCDE